VISAAGGAGALALLEADQAIDVLFLDIILGADPEAGLHVARNAMLARPDLRVIYTTGQGLTDGMQALFVKPSQFLPKPYSMEQLMAALENATSPPTDAAFKP
jgi:DNA-binding NtrC family response regulator